MQATGYFDTLADADFAVDVVTVFAAYMGTTLAAPTVDGMIPMDVPDELYGIVVIVAAEAFGGDYKRALQLGGGFYTVDAAAERYEVQSRIEGAM
mgnify:CR=1 FL=1